MITQNNILQTFEKHSKRAMVLITVSAFISFGVFYRNMLIFKKASECTFIYYKNGSSILVTDSKVKLPSKTSNTKHKY